jgi:hypothetical protein
MAVGWQHRWAGQCLGACGGASGCCKDGWPTPLADGQHFAVYACGFEYAGASSRASVSSGRSHISKHGAVADVGMLPHHLHQRHFFVTILPRSEGQIEGGTLQVAREQPTVSCLICEQQLGCRWNACSRKSRAISLAISWPVMLPSTAAATVDWTASQCSYRPRTVAKLAA